jgi:hypothetical protein
VGEGVYRAVYIANFAGTYEVSVTCKGKRHGANACLRLSSGNC